jgi:hypothetical protein
LIQPRYRARLAPELRIRAPQLANNLLKQVLTFCAISRVGPANAVNYTLMGVEKIQKRRLGRGRRVRMDDWSLPHVIHAASLVAAQRQLLTARLACEPVAERRVYPGE